MAAALAAGGTLTFARAAAADPTPLSPPHAWNFGEHETPRTLGLGGSTRAVGNSTTGVFQNPASMSAVGVYHLQGLIEFTPEANRKSFGGAIVDSVTSRLAGGVAVVGGDLDDEGLDRAFIHGRIALAFPISDRLSVGATGRYLSVKQRGVGPFGDSPVSGGLHDAEGNRKAFVRDLNFDLGLLVKATNELRLGAVGQNLTHAGDGIAPTLIGGGVGYAASTFSLAGDLVADLDSYASMKARASAGGEYLAAGVVPLRLGYRFDQGESAHAVSAGIGYTSRSFAIELGGRRVVSGPVATTFVISLAYHLDSSGLTRSAADLDR